MEKINIMLLQALKASLQGEKVTWEEKISQEEWAQLFVRRRFIRSCR